MYVYVRQGKSTKSQEKKVACTQRRGFLIFGEQLNWEEKPSITSNQQKKKEKKGKRERRR